MAVGGAGCVLHRPALLRVLWLRVLLPACQLELLAATGLLQAPATCSSLPTAKCRSSMLRQQATARQCLRRLRRWPPVSLVRAPVCLSWQELAAEHLLCAPVCISLRLKNQKHPQPAAACAAAGVRLPYTAVLSCQSGPASCAACCVVAEDDKENAALYVRFMKKAIEKASCLLSEVAIAGSPSVAAAATVVALFVRLSWSCPISRTARVSNFLLPPPKPSFAGRGVHRQGAGAAGEDGSQAHVGWVLQAACWAAGVCAADL